MPASIAAIRVEAGDVVTKINGKTVTSEQTLSFLVANIEPGTRIPIELIREGKTVKVNATVGKRPSEEEMRQQQMFDPDAEQEMAPEDAEGAVAEKLGLQVRTLTPQIIDQLGADANTTGLVVMAVDGSSDAGRKGIRRGDIILTANYSAISEIADLEQAIADAERAGREAVLLRVQRRGQPARYIAVRMR